MEKQWNIGELLRTSTAYWQACALQAGVRLGIFTVINKESRSLSHIAAAIKADERGTEYLLNALAAMGLLKKEGDLYTNGSAAREYLSSHSPEYIGHIIQHHHHILDGWAQLHEAVATGHPVEMRSYGDDVERESFLMGMFNLAMGIAPALVSQVDLLGRRRLLDLGGGPGTYAIHFCLANPDLAAVVFDRPTTEPFALKTVKRFGLADRIAFHGGDFHLDPIPGPAFDAAWLSHILHSSGPAECRKIIKKTAAALEPGGLIMIHEFILDDSKDGPEFPALFSLNMLVNNEDGRSYSEEEIRAMLEAAGVRNIARHPFRGPNDSSIICGIV
ncbi:MAG: SAM-dependent methyltransferase [Desulfobulbaceae bacterium DB1]|nr:MAG: SAM-dependent methyltransferase [Desulfobulbaceae bacterium DB1]